MRYINVFDIECFSIYSVVCIFGIVFVSCSITYTVVPIQIISCGMIANNTRFLYITL